MRKKESQFLCVQSKFINQEFLAKNWILKQVQDDGILVRMTEFLLSFHLQYRHPELVSGSIKSP